MMVLLRKSVECSAKIAMRALSYQRAALLFFQGERQTKFIFPLQQCAAKLIIKASSAIPRMPIRMKPDLTDEVRSNGIFFYLDARQRALRTGGQPLWKTHVLPATPAMRPQTFNNACGTTSIDPAADMFH
jgi:hypothetical protein